MKFKFLLKVILKFWDMDIFVNTKLFYEMHTLHPLLDQMLVTPFGLKKYVSCFLSSIFIFGKQITSCKTNHEPKTNSTVLHSMEGEFANFDKNSLPWPKGIYKVTLTLQSECESWLQSMKLIMLFWRDLEFKLDILN